MTDAKHETLDHKTYYERLTRVPIGPLAEERLGKRITNRTSQTLFCDCPAHQSKGKISLTVDLAKNCWYCFGCSDGGGPIQLIELIDSHTTTKNSSGGKMPDSHRRARDWLANREGLPPLSTISMDPEQLKRFEELREEKERVFGCLTALAHFYHEKLVASPEILSAFQTQYQISEDTIRQFQIGFADNSGVEEHLAKRGYTYENNILIECGAFSTDTSCNTVERPSPFFNQRYTFPYWTAGRVVYMIGRKTKWTPEYINPQKPTKKPSKYWKLPGHSKTRPKVSVFIQNNTLFNEEILDTLASKTKPYVLITEGVTDTISAIEHGFNAISPITVRIKDADRPRIAEKLKKIPNITVYIVPDNELSKVGTEGSNDTAAWLESEGITARIVTLPVTEQQQKARDDIKSQFGIDDTMSKKEVANTAKNLDEKDKATFDALESVAKQDMNSFYLTFTAGDFQSLINSAPTRLEMILNTFHERITEKDPTILTCDPFLIALSQVKNSDMALFKKTMTMLASHNFKQREITQAIANMHKKTPNACELVEDSRNKSTLITDALTALNISPPESCENLILPPGYELSPLGIQWKKETSTKTERKPVCSVPIFIAKRMQDVFTHNIVLQIAYYQPEKHCWHTQDVPRKIAFDRMRIISLADKGFPVGKNAKELAEYLYDLESANRLHYETADISSQMGWVEGANSEINEPPPSFLYGDICHGTTHISFSGPDDGDKQAGRAFSTQSGSASTWLDIAEHILTYYPRVAVPFYASFVTPLLHILNLNSFFVDLSAGTSSGKSIALRFVASAWGNPNEKNANSIVHSWRASITGLERIVTTQTDLPLFLDDTKTAGSTKQLRNFIYGLAEGHGKVRGSIQGTQVTRYWRTVTLSTGEAPLADYATDGGARVRVMSIEGYPFEKTDQESRELVTELNNTVCLNYGHIGPQFIDHLIANHARWPEYRTLFTNTANAILTTSGAAARLADLHAAILTAAHILHESEPSAGAILPFPFVNPFVTIWPDIEDDAKEADIGKRSMQYVWEWANANEERFIGRNTEVRSSQYGDSRLIEGKIQNCAGYWDPSDEFKAIYFFPHTIKDILEQANFDANAAVKAWKQHDWLQTGKDRKRNTVNHQNTKKIAITRHGIDAAHDGELFGIALPSGPQGAERGEENINSGCAPTITISKPHYTSTNQELYLVENQAISDNATASKLRRLDRKYNQIEPIE